MIKSNKADLVLLLVTFLASSGWLFSKMAIGGMPPLGYIGLRFLGSALILLPFTFRYFCVIDRQKLFVCSTVGVYMGLTIGIWIQAINISDRLGEGAFITSLALIMVPFLGKVLYGKSIDRFILYALPVAIIGIALLALEGGWQIEASQGLFLLSTVFCALHIVYTSEKTRKIPAILVTFIQMLVAGLATLMLSFFVETWPESIPTETWMWILGAIVFATSIRYLLLTWALKNSDAGHSALILIIEPVWTAIMSMQVFGEKMSTQNILGCSLILLALLISRWRSIFPSAAEKKSLTAH